MKKLKHKLLLGIAIVGLIAGIFAVLIYNGIIWLNTPSKADYPVRGIDAASYQGNIDWSKMEEQNIKFAFIKATEGSGFVDKYFNSNYESSEKTNIRIGAYHFFSFDSAGKTQAENYIKTVEKRENMLPPVIDVEYYNGNQKNPPDTEKTRQNLSELISLLKEHYGMNPVIYVTNETYERYIKGHFEENDIWIRSIFKSAELSDNREWTFWQYCNRGRLEGYDGAQKYIDLNVFCGSEEEFENYNG